MAGAVEVPERPSAPAEPTLLSRLDRLDVMMGYLEEIWGNKVMRKTSDEASGPTSDTGSGGEEATPNSVEKFPKPLRDAVMETKVKGSLVDRLQQLEEHVLQLSIQLEEELEHERKKEEEEEGKIIHKVDKKHRRKKGLKRLVKSYMKGKPNSQG